MIIRREEEKDYFENETLIREAFYNIYRPGCIEHYVLHKLRNDKCFMPLLDYVIEEDDSFLLIRIFDESKYENEHALYSDPECYMVNEEVANEYDKNFPYKEKVQNDNQLF